MPRLVVFRGDAVESEVRLTENPLRIGRHVGNDVVIDDSLNGVSRSHAEIRREGDSYVIVDLKSRNGIWINGKRIKEKAALGLGVPVNVGAFELVLEDDASGTFERVSSPPTVVSAGTTGGTGAASRSTATGQPPRPVGPERPWPPVSARARQILLWSGAAGAVVLICGVTYAVVRNRSRPPIEVAAVESTTTTTAEVLAAAPPENPNKALNEQDLTAAREQMAAKNYAAALSEHLQPLLERDPENVEGRELKRQADEAMAALEAAARGAKKPPPAKLEPSVEVETAGIPRKAGEAYTDYTARVRQIQSTLADGKSALEKQEYVTALARFRAVEREAPKYQAADALAAEATAKQKSAVDLAVDNGQQNEQQSKLPEARRWYEIALKHDPASVLAREKRAAVVSLMNAAAEKLYAQATAAVKMGATSQAKKLFQQVYDTTMPGDEYREKAAKQLELMNR